MKRIIQLFIATFILQNAFAQPQLNPKNGFYLYGFYSNAVLSNNTISFTSWNPKRHTPEGCAQLNNPTNGNLIFTTDGRNVFAPSGSYFKNGTGLLGTPSSTNAASIIPMNIDYGYIVTTSDAYKPLPAVANNFAYYSMYQVGLQNGVPKDSINAAIKNVQLLAPGINQFGEKAVVIRRPNDIGFYLILHSAEGSNNKLVVFRNVGTSIAYAGTYGVGTAIGIDNGQIRSTNVDINGNCKIVAAYSLAKKVDVYNFNYNTGVLSFDITYNFTSASVTPYGLEISPNGKIVYFSDYSTFGKMYSIDLPTGSIHTFQNPPTNNIFSLNSYERFGQFQNLDNGETYFTIFDRSLLCRIPNPNTFGILNTFTLNTTNTLSLVNGNISNNRIEFGLPNYNRL
jgi:hypothetical protein